MQHGTRAPINSRMERLLYSPSRRANGVEHRYHLNRPVSPSVLLTAGAKSTEMLHRSGASALESGPVLRSARSFEDENQFSGRSIMKMNEKEMLRSLNSRFSGFIDKVRYLENQNKELEEEIKEIKHRTKSAASISKEYEPQLQELRKQINEISLQKQQIEIYYYNLEDDLNSVQHKYEQETRTRTDTENQFTMLKKYISDMNDVKTGLDRKVQCLQDEITFLKKNHAEEVAEVMAQIKEAQVRPDMVSIGKGQCDITVALREIRVQLEGQTASGIQDAELGYRAEVAKLTKATEDGRVALMTTNQEISELRRKLQSKNIELESTKGMREALEKQLHDLEAQHLEEIDHYQSTMRELEKELHHSQFDLAEHLKEYQDLLNVKMALDTEIFSYRKLLEGEECRYSIVTDANASVPYIYRQSPVYTLPCISRHGGGSLRAEPQYKFVEEIITETTREDVEIDVTESEDEGDKLEKQSSEEDEQVAQGKSEDEVEEAQGTKANGGATVQSPEKKMVDGKGDTTHETSIDAPEVESNSKVDKASEPDAQEAGKHHVTNDSNFTVSETGDGTEASKNQEKSEDQESDCGGGQEDEMGSNNQIELKAEQTKPVKMCVASAAKGNEPAKDTGVTPQALGGTAEVAEAKETNTVTSTSSSPSTNNQDPTENKETEVGTDVNAKEQKTQPKEKVLNNTVELTKEPDETRMATESTQKTKAMQDSAKPEFREIVDAGKQSSGKK